VWGWVGVGEGARWDCLFFPELVANGVRASRSLARMLVTLWIVSDRCCMEHIVISNLVTSESAALATEGPFVFQMNPTPLVKPKLILP